LFYEDQDFPGDIDESRYWLASNLSSAQKSIMGFVICG
jgi:hypothetical protein